MLAIYIADKPIGIFSRRLYSKYRYLSKICHVGTLDYCAAGKIIILTDESTKLSNFLVESKKGYYFSIILGYSTITDDMYGKICSKTNNYNIDTIVQYINSISGEYTQKVPMISAKRINGKRLYSINRNKQSYANTSQSVTCNVHSCKVVDYTDRVIYAYVLATGCFYVRALPVTIRDIFKFDSHIGFIYRFYYFAPLLAANSFLVL